MARGSMFLRWFVPATACKLVFIYIFNELMDVDEVVPGKSIVPMCRRGNTAKLATMMPSIWAPTSHRNGKDPSYKLTPTF